MGASKGGGRGAVMTGPCCPVGVQSPASFPLRPRGSARPPGDDHLAGLGALEAWHGAGPSEEGLLSSVDSYIF